MQKYLCLSSYYERSFLFLMSASKYDNAFKQKVLLKEIDKKVASIKRDNYKKEITTCLIDDFGECFAFMPSNSWREMISPYKKGFNMIDCADRLLESRYRKAKKVRDKISKLVITNNSIFITLTFSDKTLANTDIDKRRRLVQRYLKSNCSQYVANIDYGKTNGREHYHALVSNDIDFTDWYKYGTINAERVRPCEDSPKRLSRYITKLTNHALKVGAIAPRLIYSRNTI